MERLLQDVAARIDTNKLPGLWRFENGDCIDGWIKVSTTPGVLELQVMDYSTFLCHLSRYTDNGTETHKLLEELRNLLSDKGIFIELDMGSIRPGTHHVSDHLNWTCPISHNSVPKERAVYVSKDVGPDNDVTRRVHTVYDINSMQRLIGTEHSDNTHISPMTRQPFTSWNLRSLP